MSSKGKKFDEGSGPEGPTKGIKFDLGKPDLSLIPLSAMQQEALGYMFGAKRYGRYNYAKGMEASRLIAAALRHATAWYQGENIDPDSGIHHLGLARCNFGMLLECERLGTLIDDRNLAGLDPGLDDRNTPSGVDTGFDDRNLPQVDQIEEKINDLFCEPVLNELPEVAQQELKHKIRLLWKDRVSEPETEKVVASVPLGNKEVFCTKDNIYITKGSAETFWALKNPLDWVK
jgi:hypothetical protein